MAISIAFAASTGVAFQNVIETDSEVFDTLIQIAQCDPGLTVSRSTEHQSSAGGFPLPAAVYYTQKKAAVASSTRLLALVNSSSSVLIMGVTDSFVTPTNIPITAVGAFTAPAFLLRPITIYIDVTEASGQGYYSMGKDGLQIYSPLAVTLYHELAHAYHMIQKDIPIVAAAAEVQAMTDENVFRSELGLTLRDITDYSGGVGSPNNYFPRCKAPYEGWSPGWKCLVATAAVGSPHAPVVAELRRTRDQFKNLCGWTGLISKPVLEAYSRISPSIVRDMEADPELKDAVLNYAIQPFVNLIHIVDLYRQADLDSPDFLNALGELIEQYTTEVATSGGSVEALATTAEGALLAAEKVSGGAQVEASRHHFLWPRDLYSYLASVISSDGHEAAGFSWALEGVSLVLQQAFDRWSDGRGITADFPQALGAWLARFPLPTDALLNLTDVRQELEILKVSLFTHQYIRELFAQNLLARTPEKSISTLLSLLREMNYIGNE